MRKIKIVSIILIFLLMILTSSYAAIDPTISFDISYQGEVKVNEEKSALIILAGQNTPAHTNVRVKVDIQGPLTPKILATDSSGIEHDIAQLGYWGPDAGFAIGGTFSNETPIKATFTYPGAYAIKLSLIDVQNANNILAEKEVTIQVKEATANNPIVNQVVNEIVNEPVSELPKTGISLGEYAVYAIMLFVVVYLGYQIKQRRG